MLGVQVLVLLLCISAFITDGRRTKNILLYTPLLRMKNWHLGSNWEDHSYFERLNCPETNCVITTDREYLPSIKDFDVIAMNSWNNISMDMFPSADLRHLDQIYVLHFRESPIRTTISLTPYSHLFNWTMSYRFDADVFLPYGHFEDIHTKGIVAPALNPGWRRPDFNAPITKSPTVIELVEKKPKLAAWFVSSCYSPSERKYVVKKMQQYMTVDVFGKCGTKNCTKHNKKACREMVEQDFKFYLSFENSLCTDYITEKVFSIMKYYVVPVVFGGVDYNRFLPPHSYINVADFDSVEDLVEYLQYLANNTDEYIKYLWWKDYYTVTDVANMCGICEKITQVGDRPRFSKQYKDLDQWFKNGTCQDPKKIPLVYKALKSFRRIKD